jgi:hypothetical protein
MGCVVSWSGEELLNWRWRCRVISDDQTCYLLFSVVKNMEIWIIPLKDHHFGSIPLPSHLHVGPHESMTCGVHGIYLKFGSFNGIDPIVPKKYKWEKMQAFHLI